MEVAGNLPGIVAVRDSKDPAGPLLAFTPAAWQGFTADMKDGKFNLACITVAVLH